MFRVIKTSHARIRIKILCRLRMASEEESINSMYIVINHEGTNKGEADTVCPGKLRLRCCRSQ